MTESMKQTGHNWPEIERSVLCTTSQAQGKENTIRGTDRSSQKRQTGKKSETAASPVGKPREATPIWR